MAIVLGTEVTDSITGFKGIAVSRAEFLYGCVRVEVQPITLDDHGDRRKSEFFDEAQLKENNPATTPTLNPLLGKAVEDSITGFKGIAVVYSTYLHAGPRVVIQPPRLHKTNGVPLEQMIVDVPQLKGFKALKEAVKAALKTGGPRDVAPPHRVATRG